MSTDKLWTVISGIEYQLNILKDKLKSLDEETKQSIDDAYQRGLDDAWEAARKIVCDDELDWNTLLHIFNRSNFEGIFGDFSPSEAIDKLKSYKEKQKADDEIDEKITGFLDCNGYTVDEVINRLKRMKGEE